MWIRKGSDVTIDSETQHPYFLWHQGQGGVYLTDPEYGGLSSDGTAGAMAGLSPPEARDPEARGLGKGGSSDNTRWRRTVTSRIGAATLEYSKGERGIGV